MKICVIGLGYIGLPTSLIMASKGLDVHGVDVNAKLINTLQNGMITFEEEGLFELYNEAVSNGMTFNEEVIKAGTYIITVPTPFIKETKKIDPSYLVSAFKDILEVCEENSIVVIESTVSPGTITQYIRPLLLKYNKQINLVHAPERILPGAMINELVNNSRTIGSDNYEIGNTVIEIYKTFCKGDIVLTDIETAEMSKVVENTFRDINIAYANELAQLCEQAGLDVYKVIEIANMHPRVNILQPGPGVGGHCISVDPWFLVGDYPENTDLIHQARKVNDAMPAYILNRIKSIMAEYKICDMSKVGLYGLTYKEDVDDVRESPTLQLLSLIENENIKVYDPMISTKIIDGQVLDFDDFIGQIELMVVMVSHKHLKKVNIPNSIIIFDTKNSLKKENIITL